MRDSNQNRTILLERRRELRKLATPAEKNMWERLRNRRTAGVKFYRQYSIGPYIADFCSYERRLVIEIDGKIHGAEFARGNDAVRTEYLGASGFRVLRFTNDEALSNTDAVIEAIAEACRL